MTEKFNQACLYATKKHEGQMRKSTPMPYIVHIYEVVQLLKESGADEDTIVAGILHDTVEDTNTTLSEIKELFGEKIAAFVDVLSEDKSLPYAERKHIQAQRIAKAPFEAKLIKCADCLSNLRSTYLDTVYEENPWSKFNSSIKNIQAHYMETMKGLADLKDVKMFQELQKFYLLTFSKRTQGIVTAYSNGKIITDCTECQNMERHPDPDPNDWFCYDDEKYVCGKTGQTLSCANRPYEKQTIPSTCPNKIL